MSLSNKNMDEPARSRRGSAYTHSDHKGMGKNCSINSKNKPEKSSTKDSKKGYEKSPSSEDSSSNKGITSKDIVLML